MTGMNEVTAIGDLTSSPLSAPVVESASVSGNEATFKGASSFLKNEEKGGFARWENFEGAPKSLAGAVQSLVGGFVEGPQKVQVPEGSSLRSENPKVLQASASDVPATSKSEVVTNNIGVESSRPGIGSQKDEFFVEVPQKSQVPEGSSLRSENPKGAQTVAGDVPVASKSEVVTNNVGVEPSRPAIGSQKGEIFVEVPQKSQVPEGSSLRSENPKVPQTSASDVSVASKGEVVTNNVGVEPSRPVIGSQKGEIFVEVPQKSQVSEGSSLRIETQKGAQASASDVPVTSKSEVVVNNGGVEPSRPGIGSQKGEIFVDVPQKAQIPEGNSLRSENPKTPQAVAGDVPVASKGEVVADNGGRSAIAPSKGDAIVNSPAKDDKPVEGDDSSVLPLNSQSPASKSPGSAFNTQIPTFNAQLSDLNTQAMRAHLVSAVNAIAETIAVTPTLASTGEGEIRIQLKSDILDGSSIKLEAKGGSLQIVVTPATRAAEEMLLKNYEMFQAQLAERVTAWRINVGIATLSPRQQVKSEDET